MIFDSETIHKSVINQNRVSVQFRYEVLDKKFKKRSVNQVISKDVKKYWLKNLLINYMHKYVDSCVYTNNYEIKNLLKLKKHLQKNYCKKALLQIPKYKIKEIQYINKKL